MTVFTRQVPRSCLRPAHQAYMLTSSWDPGQPAWASLHLLHLLRQGPGTNASQGEGPAPLPPSLEQELPGALSTDSWEEDTHTPAFPKQLSGQSS